jgi:uncharacterized glyoxalase superfamily protein PhnB
MPSPAKDTIATVIPGLHYRDAPAAIEWLCRVLGFKRHLVVPGPDGTIAHAELSFGHGMIMLGSGESAAKSEISLIVADADAHYAVARAAGAEMMIEIEDKPYGGRGYACRDPEGHVWGVVTYDPWA